MRSFEPLATSAVRAGAATETRYAQGMPGWISPWELLILALVVLLVFGPKRLPGLGKQLGTGMREFKDSIAGKDNDDDDDKDERPRRKTSERRDVETALGRPEGEQAPLEGEVVRERTTH